MRIVICHGCWSWVLGTGTTCPECHQYLDVGQPDPPEPQFALEFGEYVSRLGTVKLERRQLPDMGSLVGTSAGLLFVPFLTVLPDGGLSAPERLSRGTSWSRWRWWGSTSASGPSFQALAQNRLEPAAPELVRAFLDSPGAIFVPRSHLLRLEVRGNGWSLARTLGPTLQLTFRSSPEEWKPAWRQLTAACPDWHALVE